MARSTGRGGDVSGTTRYDNFRGVGKGIEVARASFDPGYPLTETLSDAGTRVSEADLRQGYCTYGKTVGEAS